MEYEGRIYSGRGLQGTLPGIFLTLLSLHFTSGHGEERAACIIYSPAFDSLRLYAHNPSQFGVNIVVITVWLGLESIHTGAQSTLISAHQLDQALQKAVPRWQSSAKCKVEKGLLTLIGAFE